MGQKVDPRGIRIGITKTWDSRWFAEGKEYLNNFHEDIKIKEYIKKNYYHAGISTVQVERTSPTDVTVIIETGKAGILIGRKGQEIEALKVNLEKLTNKKVQVKVLEIKNPNKDAQLVAESIATAIEKRIAYKRAVQQAIQRAEKAGVKGIICFGMGVTLREGSREYYYKQLDRLFPGMKEKYQMTYNDQYTLNSPHNRDLMNLFFKKCQEYQMMCNYLEIFEYLQEFEEKTPIKKKDIHDFEQLSLF